MKAVDLKKIQSADLQSIGYSAASHGDVINILAMELLRRCPNGLTDEAKAELELGMIGRKAELVGTVNYIHKGSEYTLIEDVSKAGDDDAVVAFSVDYAMSMSAYDFGQLKNKDRAKYDIIAGIRTSVSKYKSNRMTDLLRAMDRLKDGKGRTRSSNKAFAEWICDSKKGLVQAMLTRQATAKKNGDPTAPTDKAGLIKMLTDAINKA